MFFSGTIRHQSKSLANHKQTLAYFDEKVAQNIQIQEEGPHVTLLLPGLDRFLFPLFKHPPSAFNTPSWETLTRLLWDEITLTFQPDGSILYCLNYWTPGQLILHGLLNWAILGGITFPLQTIEPYSLLTLVILGNALPILSSHLNAFLFIHKLAKRIQTQELA